MALHYVSGSEIKYAAGLSFLAVAAAGSSNAIDFSAYTHLTVLVQTDSADLVVNLERSATSLGTFAQVGLSIPSKASGIALRTYAGVVSGSAVWYKVSYDNQNLGSVNSFITMVGHGARFVPITQDSNTVVYSQIA